MEKDKIRYYVIRKTIDFLVPGNTPDTAMDFFSNHGMSCREIQQFRPTAGCTGDSVEALDTLDALTEISRYAAP